MSEQARKWRLILSKDADQEQSVELEGEEIGMDNTLEAIYNTERKGGLGASSPSVNRWLGDIRKYFPNSVVQLLQRDALDRLGLHQMLLEPELLETLTPNIHLVGTLLSLKKIMPKQTKESARELVRQVVEGLQKRLQNPLKAAIRGALKRDSRNRRPKWQDVDWHRTIRANLKHYQQKEQTIIPELLLGYGRKSQSLRHVILLVDQSGSMATSVVYASVFGAIMASLSTVKTHFIAFDTNVVNLSEHLDDPVDLLFAAQLGGGTDIAKALGYARQLITQPKDTVVILISDLYEGGHLPTFYQQVDGIQQSGAQLISLLALNDEGAPSYDRNIATQLANRSIPCFACTPDRFPEIMANAINKH